MKANQRCEKRDCREVAFATATVRLAAPEGGGEVRVWLCAKHHADCLAGRLPNGWRLEDNERVLTHPTRL